MKNTLSIFCDQILQHRRLDKGMTLKICSLEAVAIKDLKHFKNGSELMKKRGANTFDLDKYISSKTLSN